MYLFNIHRLRLASGMVLLAGLFTANQASAGIIVEFSNRPAGTNVFWNKVTTPQETQPFIGQDSNSIYQFLATSPQPTIADGGQAGGVSGGTSSSSSLYSELTFSANRTLQITTGQPAGSIFTFDEFTANINADADGYLRVDVLGIGFAPFSAVLSDLKKSGQNSLSVRTNTALESISSVTLTTIAGNLLTSPSVNNIAGIRQFRVNNITVSSTGGSTSVPEPASLTLLSMGVSIMGIVGIRRRQNLQKYASQAN